MRESSPGNVDFVFSTSTGGRQLVHQREEEWAQLISVLSHCQVVRRGQSRTRKKNVSAKGRLLFPSGEAIPSALSSLMRATLLRYRMQSTEKRRLLGRKSESGKLPRFCERRKLGLELGAAHGPG